MGVLKCDASAADAYLEKDGISWPSSWYAEYRIAFPSATLTALAALGTGNVFAASFWEIDDSGGTSVVFNSIGDPGVWSAAGVTSPAEMYAVANATKTQAGVFAADTWNTVKIHFDGTTLTYTINGEAIPALSDTLDPLHDIPDKFFVGGRFGSHTTSEIYYLDDVKIGTTLGGTDLFSDDFEGDLSGWTDVVGSASIVSDPGYPAGDPPDLGGGGGGSYTGHAPSFTIVNLSHDGTAASTVIPVANSLEWTYRLAQMGGPGDATWEVALSDPVLTADQFAPKRTDWKLVMDGTTDLCAGIVTAVNLVSESDSGVFGVVRCQGLDWLHYLEQPYGFNYATVAADQRANQLGDHDMLWRVYTTNTSGGVAGVLYNATQATVVADMLDSISGYTDAVAFTTSMNGSGWSEGVNMNLGLGDDSTILDMIVGLASLDDPYGFDMYVDPDKTIQMWAPRRVQPSAATPVYTLDDSSIVSPPLDWTNNGPNSTDTVMLGEGSSNTRTVGEDHYQPSRDVYRQWVRIGQADFPDAVSIAKAAGSEGYWDRFPHKDLKLTLRPDLLDNTDATAGFQNMLGEVIAVDYNVTPYHHIDANFWITEQHYYSPDGCNWLADFTLSQIYTTSATPTP